MKFVRNTNQNEDPRFEEAIISLIHAIYYNIFFSINKHKYSLHMYNIRDKKYCVGNGFHIHHHHHHLSMGWGGEATSTAAIWSRLSKGTVIKLLLNRWMGCELDEWLGSGRAWMVGVLLWQTVCEGRKAREEKMKN